MSLARATISGIIIGDPEKRFTPNNIAVANFAVQVFPNGMGRNDQPFVVRAVCWRNLADTAAERLRKGQEVTLEGRLQVHQYEAPGGLVKRTYEIDVSHLYLGHLEPVTPAGGAATGQATVPSGSYRPPMDASPAPTPSPSPSSQPQPVGVATAPTQQWGTPPSFTPDDLLTEDDIPF